MTLMIIGILKGAPIGIRSYSAKEKPDAEEKVSLKTRLKDGPDL
jgi:hypothetical protein